MPDFELVEDIDELAEDVPEGEDGDDSLHATEAVPPSDLQVSPRLGSSAKPKPGAKPKQLLVPYRRAIRLGTVGRDVVAVKRALIRAGAMASPGKGKLVTPLWGPLAKKQLRAWQRRHLGGTGDGSYGRRTHTAFIRRKMFDAYGAWLMAHARIETPEERKREKIVQTALFGAAHEPSIHYTQSALRFWGVRNKVRPPGIPRYEDCSSFSSWCYWVAGLPDPNGFNWAGYGWTGTLQQHGRRMQSPKRGDLVFYGSGGNSHVTIYIGGGKCVSHGNSSGPRILNWRYRSDMHSVRSYL